MTAAVDRLARISEHRADRVRLLAAHSRCSECDGGMVLGQPGRHWSCSPTCIGCSRPLGPHGENCHCSTATQRRQRQAMQGDRS